MKKFLLLLFSFFTLAGSCFASEGISFLYINGSNNNDAKMKKWYENGVKKLHPQLKDSFEKSPLASQFLLKSGKYHIQKDPVIFYWGDKSRDDLSFVEKNLAISKGFSPWFAYQVRFMLAHFLHDAIWVQKYHNMLPILQDLHVQIASETQKGNKVVLYGYSAGSFITYEYLLTRLPYIGVKDFFNNVKVGPEVREYVAKNPAKDTCMTALGYDLAVFSATGHIVPNDDFETFKRDYKNLDALTDKYCTPEGALKGIVNFASPLVLFYSDISDPNYELTYYNRLLLKYIIEKDLFWLTVNYREDPLGFPTIKNLTIEEIEDAAKIQIEPHQGFIYDMSNVWSKRTFIGAHTSYWSSGKTFSKAVVKAYDNGYRHQYDENFKQKSAQKFERKYHFHP